MKSMKDEKLQNSINNDTITSRVRSDVSAMRMNLHDIRFATLKRVCDEYFGAPRNTGSSHFVYKMPWAGDPRINIQSEGGMAKAYQVKQVLRAIDRLEGGQYGEIR